MRVLVTGAAGFIGSHIASAVQEAGHEVRGLDSLTPAVHNGRPSDCDFELVVGDVRDPAAVDEALAGVDAVCHQAAMVGLGVDLSDLPLYSDVNVTGTAVLLEAMGRHGIGRLVFASSMVVYGEGAYDCAAHGRVRPSPRDPADLAAGVFEPRCPSCGAPLDTSLVGEDAPLDPRNAYAMSKVAQEHLAASWARLTGGTAVGLRYHNVYGPRMPRDTPYSGVAAIFRSCLENGVAPRVFEDGGQRRDFVHVRDVARANLLALDSLGALPAGALRCYNVASGEPHTVGEMAFALAEAFGAAGTTFGAAGAGSVAGAGSAIEADSAVGAGSAAVADGAVGSSSAAGTSVAIEPVVTGDFRLGDVRHIVASPEGAAHDLGFRAQIRFAEGMAEFASAPLREPVLARA